MFEDKTAAALLKEALAAVSDKLDKREGAIIYDTLAPFCNELARAYSDLELALQQLFPQTAARDYLMLIAQQRGFKPKAATALEIKVYADAEPEMGARFNMQEYNYTAAESLGGGMYRLVCETPGSAPNGSIGVITPINYIDGLKELRFESIIKPGTDEEETEAFRERFIEGISDVQAFGGNVSDYRAKVGAISGVGMVKVFPAYDWKGAGTVGIYITDESGEPASAELAAAVKEQLDPAPGGTGTGTAPIGHIVDVMPAGALPLDIKVDILAERDGTDYEAEVRNAVSELLKTVNKDWDKGSIYFYSGRLIVELMKIKGAVNISNININGGDGVSSNNEKLFVQKSLEVNVSYA